MSYAEVFAVRSNGDVTKYGEAHNAFGGAMHIWLTLDKKYGIGSPIMDFRPLWRQVKELREADRWVLASTFDNFLVEREHLPTLIKHLEAFVKDYPTPTLIEEIAVLKRALEDENVQAIGFNQTSVNADMWRVPLSEEEIVDYSTRPYNINVDTGHKYLTPEYFEK